MRFSARTRLENRFMPLQRLRTAGSSSAVRRTFTVSAVNLPRARSSLGPQAARLQTSRVVLLRDFAGEPPTNLASCTVARLCRRAAYKPRELYCCETLQASRLQTSRVLLL